MHYTLKEPFFLAICNAPYTSFKFAPHCIAFYNITSKSHSAVGAVHCTKPSTAEQEPTGSGREREGEKREEGAAQQGETFHPPLQSSKPSASRSREVGRGGVCSAQQGKPSVPTSCRRVKEPGCGMYYRWTRVRCVYRWKRRQGGDLL